MSNKSSIPKIDLKSIVGQIKSVISSGTEEPNPVSSDDLGQQMKSISELSEQLAQQHAQLTQGLYELHEKVNVLYQSLEAFRSQSDESSDSPAGPSSESAVDTSDSKK